MVMDMRPLVKFTYEMEGDRLEGLLLVEKMEELRSMGRQIKSCAPVLSNLAAVVRRDIELKPGVVISEYFGAPYNQYFKGKITKVGTGDPILHTVKYEDGTTIEAEDHELRQWLPMSTNPEYVKYCGYAHGAFAYLERRITNDCAEAYHYAENYHTWELARFFNPAWAEHNLTHALVASLVDLAFIRHHALVDELSNEVRALPINPGPHHLRHHPHPCPHPLRTSNTVGCCLLLLDASSLAASSPAVCGR